MSSELETILKDIEENKFDLREVKEELKIAKDPARREKLENRRELLETTIVTDKKRVLALTLQPVQQGKKYHIGKLHLPFVFPFQRSIVWILYHYFSSDFDSD